MDQSEKNKPILIVLPLHLLLLGLEDELLNELLSGFGSLGPFFLLLVA